MPKGAKQIARLAFLTVAASLLLLVAVGHQISEPKLAEIPACVESDPIYPGGDADDPAIWVNRASPRDSVIIGTDKQAGLHVYDLAGRELQFVPLGKTNNVDLRPDFPFPDGPARIIAVTSRTDNTVTLLRFDEQARRIEPEPLVKIPAFGRDPGVCLYRDKHGSIHVGATGSGGHFAQWRLNIRNDGTITPQRIRSLKFSSSAEACVFDDALNRLYLAQERVGIWRLPAEPDRGHAATLIDKTGADFPRDVEGLAIVRRKGGTGYLIASNQGNSTFRIYRRESTNSYLGRFRIAGCQDGVVEAVSGTDGVEVVADSLGSKWPAGMLVVHDGGNRVGPKTLPNLKYVSLDRVQQLIDSWKSAQP